MARIETRRTGILFSTASALLLSVVSAAALDCSSFEQAEEEASMDWQAADDRATAANAKGDVAQSQLPAAQQALQKCLDDARAQGGFTPQGGQAAACATQATTVQNLQNDVNAAANANAFLALAYKFKIAARAALEDCQARAAQEKPPQPPELPVNPPMPASVDPPPTPPQIPENFPMPASVDPPPPAPPTRTPPPPPPPPTTTTTTTTSPPPPPPNVGGALTCNYTDGAGGTASFTTMDPSFTECPPNIFPGLTLKGSGRGPVQAPLPFNPPDPTPPQANGGGCNCGDGSSQLADV
jgi:hypothetical protein